MPGPAFFITPTQLRVLADLKAKKKLQEWQYRAFWSLQHRLMVDGSFYGSRNLTRLGARTLQLVRDAQKALAKK